MQTIEHDLDHLVPPFPSTPKRLALSVVVLGTAVAATYLVLAGWLYPRITVDSRAGSYVLEQNAPVRLGLGFNNPGHRSLRIDEAVLRVDGVGIPATISVWPSTEISETANGAQASEATENQHMLPIVLQRGDRASIDIDIVPADCIDGLAKIDADAEIHYSFADGPPSISRTARINDVFADVDIQCSGS